MNNFDTLPTVLFQTRMKAHAMAIYQSLFPGCRIEDLRENGCKVHVLDREFAIDSLLHLKSGQWLSIQEKYRNNEFLTDKNLQTHQNFPDFTQEITNATGTPNEGSGEWSKLAAQLYFYGWAKKDCSGFARWVVLDIPKYKLLVEEAGGIERFGNSYTNRTHGRATFIAFPIYRVSSCLLFGSTGCLERFNEKEQS